MVRPPDDIPLSPESLSPEPVPHGTLTALAEPRIPVRFRWIGCITLANLALWMGFYTPLQVLLPNQIAGIDPAGKVAALGWVTAAGAAVSVVANPVAGALSDRTTCRFGRRHPWTLGGALIGGSALALLGQQHTVLAIALLWCVVQGSLNAMQASVTAGIPDHVPVTQRAAVSGWIGIPQAFGLVLGAALVTVVVTGNATGYAVVAAGVLLLVLPYVLGTPDPVLPAHARPSLSIRRMLRDMWVSPRACPDFGWAWITRFLVMLANALGTLYLLYFLQDAVHYGRLFPGQSATQGLFILIAIYTAGVAATAVLGGAISDRLGRRRVLVTISGLVITVAAVLLAVRETWPMAMVAAAVFGAGLGVYLAVDQALITQVLPKAADRAKDLGLINIANSLPQVLGPAIAAPIVGYVGGYPALYTVTAVIAVAGSVLVWRIKSVR